MIDQENCRQDFLQLCQHRSYAATVHGDLGQATGHYSSASEVIQVALREHIYRGEEHQLNLRIKVSKEHASRGKVIDADIDYFQDKRDMIREKYLSI